MLNARKLFVIDQIVLHLSMKVILGIVRIIRKLSAFVNRVPAQRKDNLAYLHFSDQGLYFSDQGSYTGPCKVYICLYLACISPYLDLSPNTDKYKLYKAVYGSFHTMLIKKNCRECHKIVQLYISKYFP